MESFTKKMPCSNMSQCHNIFWSD